jgi:glycosyltransferase involved in cell wall biosynthesis
MIAGLTSIIIPSRNEKYLQSTILDLLSNAKEQIEIIAILDGYWPKVEEIVNDKRVTYTHFFPAQGMRHAINSGVSISRGEYVLKTDAHCSFGVSYDRILKDDCEDNWVVVPRRYPLDPEKWQIINNPKYPVDYMFLNSELHGEVWKEKNNDLSLKGLDIDDLMSSQGSCWFMKRSSFDFLELMDESRFGTFWQEFQEIGLKAWLSGGRVVVNKNTWYAHWHKTEGRGYSLKENTEGKDAKHFLESGWSKQKYDLKWLINKFSPVPTW